MARVTVEDCVDKIPNRFELLLIAAHRARMLRNGSHMSVEPENDKNPVIALREIAANTISVNDLRESLIHSIQNRWRSTSRRRLLHRLRRAEIAPPLDATVSRSTRLSIRSQKMNSCAAWRT